MYTLEINYPTGIIRIARERKKDMGKEKAPVREQTIEETTGIVAVTAIPQNPENFKNDYDFNAAYRWETETESGRRFLE